ncbi:10972_t:CDS:2 [Dentiscutata heterogama]|uniref:10972_t:CDS:1 n=1 Tax=Dentiscutata heterogama TaxID=1316150 RepID=A0ACA9M4M3_9GLOM|nr:10972_t:CDS:2 [Dentiscutata heterogama]
MNEICEIVTSQKGKDKLNIHGYLLIKEQNRKNTYYWCCEERKSGNCKGRAVTVFDNGQHYLKKFKKHNHSPRTGRKDVVKLISNIKQQAKNTRDKPSQIIQNNLANVSEGIIPYIPSYEALRSTIKRARRTESTLEPKSLDEIDIPTSLCFTLSGDLFFLKNAIVDQEGYLLFSTIKNIRYLSQATFWLMDGTFKIVPKLFYQLYTIHAPVGATSNCRILPLVYVLMTNKNEELYQQLFQDLNEIAEENNIALSPSIIITDFERASINASRNEFPDTTNKCCFFHLGQSGWRKIQKVGLANQYGDDDNLSLRLRQLFALAFLPANEIPSAFIILKQHMPSITSEVVEWFEFTYVLGKPRRELQDGVPRTQNKVEAWHHRFGTLVGRLHVGVYTIIQEFQKEQQFVELEVERIIRGDPQPKRRQQIIDQEQRIMEIVNNRTNLTVMNYLRGIAYNFSL